mmetsp:Transcript_5681/g.11925  ORF Transcript_5681/g.11925 Transcript_5681/m.11925 type:complete len:122 (-) Transcript_5681:332-697(-)
MFSSIDEAQPIGISSETKDIFKPRVVKFDSYLDNTLASRVTNKSNRASNRDVAPLSRGVDISQPGGNFSFSAIDPLLRAECYQITGLYRKCAQSSHKESALCLNVTRHFVKCNPNGGVDAI